MMTWTYKRSGYIAIVTAENVKQAIYQLSQNGVSDAAPADLIPVVTQTRFTRILAGNKDDKRCN